MRSWSIDETLHNYGAAPSKDPGRWYTVNDATLKEEHFGHRHLTGKSYTAVPGTAPYTDACCLAEKLRFR